MRSILAAYDGSFSAQAAFEFALDLARIHGEARQVIADANCAVTVVRPKAAPRG